MDGGRGPTRPHLIVHRERDVRRGSVVGWGLGKEASMTPLRAVLAAAALAALAVPAAASAHLSLGLGAYVFSRVDDQIAVEV